uniref:Chaperone DnaJ C-terminal domain-containing protein n=1 Tax=Solanum lycopersicum TaxID=4081 RepID=A0A3Q7IWI9_SOLLC
MVNPRSNGGTKISFKVKGDEREGDIIFSIDEKIHPLYKREGDDLLLGVKVRLVQTLTGCTIIVPLLRGDEVMTMTFDDEIFYPGFEKVIQGQGMPKSKQE